MHEFGFGQFVFAGNPVCTKIRSANLWNLKSPYVFSVNSVVSKDNNVDLSTKLNYRGKGIKFQSENLNEPAQNKKSIAVVMWQQLFSVFA